MHLTVLAKIPAQCFTQQLVILLSTHVHIFQKAPTHTHDLFKSQGLKKHDYFKLNQQLKKFFLINIQAREEGLNIFFWP